MHTDYQTHNGGEEPIETLPPITEDPGVGIDPFFDDDIQPVPEPEPKPEPEPEINPGLNLGLPGCTAEMFEKYGECYWRAVDHEEPTPSNGSYFKFEDPGWRSERDPYPEPTDRCVPYLMDPVRYAAESVEQQ